MKKQVSRFLLGDDSKKIQTLKEKLLSCGLEEKCFRPPYLDIDGTQLTCELEESRHPGDDMHFYTLSFQGTVIAETRQKIASYESYKYFFVMDDNFHVLPNNLKREQSDIINPPTAKVSHQERNNVASPSSATDASQLNADSKRHQVTAQAKASLLSSRPTSVDPEQKIIKELKGKLQAYIDRVRGGARADEKINYSSGFWFYKQSRAINREANYKLAVKLLEKLDQPSPSLRRIFDWELGIIGERDNIINREILPRLEKEHKRSHYVARGINSTELNRIIKDATDYIDAHSLPYTPTARGSANNR